MHEPASAPISFAYGDEDSALILPPLPSDKVCTWCRGLLGGRVSACFNCEENAAALDGQVQAVTPISLYAKPGALRDWLTFYKDDGEVLADPNAGLAIESVVGRFLQHNSEWLHRIRPDLTIVVPSTLRPPPHPLAVLLQRTGAMPAEVSFALRRTTAELGHNRPNRDAFRTMADLHGMRIFLLDDVYTSGARAQSAAFALREAGATVVALCAVGRRYNPAYSEDSAEIYQHQAASPFSWSVADREITRTSGDE